MSAASRKWKAALMGYCYRGKVHIRPNTAHSCAGVPYAIRFAAWGYGVRVSKRAVRRKIKRNALLTPPAQLANIGDVK